MGRFNMNVISDDSGERRITVEFSAGELAMLTIIYGMSTSKQREGWIALYHTDYNVPESEIIAASDDDEFFDDLYQLFVRE
jgi:hypothetical protein